MQTKAVGLFLGCVLFFSGGHLMADPISDPSSEGWVTVKDEEVGIKADFPHRPLEMSFDIPFQNTPPTGKVHLYSVPTQAGILVLSTLVYENEAHIWLEKEQLQHFFDVILVPHLFFNPKIFKEEQVFRYTPLEDGFASFQVTFRDHGMPKRLEGFAHVKENTLYVYFYLASESEFDVDLLKHFTNSVHPLPRE